MRAVGEEGLGTNMLWVVNNSPVDLGQLDPRRFQFHGRGNKIPWPRKYVREAKKTVPDSTQTKEIWNAGILC